MIKKLAGYFAIVSGILIGWELHKLLPKQEETQNIKEEDQKCLTWEQLMEKAKKK